MEYLSHCEFTWLLLSVVECEIAVLMAKWFWEVLTLFLRYGNGAVFTGIAAIGLCRQKVKVQLVIQVFIFHCLTNGIRANSQTYPVTTVTFVLEEFLVIGIRERYLHLEVIH